MKPPALTSSSTAICGIELIEYNLLGLPERITLSSGEKVVNAYDGRGVKHSTMLLDAAGRTVTKRQYIGDAIIDDGKLTMQLFEGGYLDAAGNAYYYITDWQGNITAVVDASGNIVQSTGYYPDGEPWEEPQGDNRLLFAGKERVGIGGLNMYDFGPRMYNAAGCFWYQPDPAAASYPHISPYSYCAGNPVRFVDPSGKDIVVLNYSGGFHMAMLIQNENGKWQYYSINGDNKYLLNSHTGGRPFNDVAIGSWDSPQEFLNSTYNVKNDESKENRSMNNYGFEEGYLIPTTPEQDATMREGFAKRAKSKYNLLDNNCAIVVQQVMIDAGIPVSEPKTAPSTIPISTVFGVVDVFNGYKIECGTSRVPGRAFESIIRWNPEG